VSGSGPEDSDLEALVSPKIKEAIRAAVDKIGEKELAKITGVSQSQIDLALLTDQEYLPVKIVSVICQINRSHGDPNLEHSSVSACLKGTTVRLPPARKERPRLEERKRTASNPFEQRAPVGPLFDQKSSRLANFGVNTIMLLVLSYFLGGVALAPALGWSSCPGVAFSPFRAEWCLGSVLGLILGAFGSLAYTYYYFTHNV